MSAILSLTPANQINNNSSKDSNCNITINSISNINNAALSHHLDHQTTAER
jgi:hypothetical protein